MFITFPDYVLQTSVDQIKEKSFTLKKTRSGRYMVDTKIDADNADSLALLANTLAQVNSLLHNLEEPAGSISLRPNVNKTEFL